MKNCTVNVFSNAMEMYENPEMSFYNHESKPIGKTEVERWGFVDALPGEMAAKVSDGYMLAIQKQERILPSWAVKDDLAEKVAEWEQATGQAVSKAAKKDMREEIELDLLPQCFVRKTVYYAWLGKDRLLIDSKSAKVCDAVTSLLREALGSLPCINVAPRSVPGAVMAGWLQDSAMLPSTLALAGESTIRAKEDESGKIKIKDAELNKSSIDDALDCCPMVKEMALSHNNAISFTLNEQLQLSKIKLSDTLQEQVSDDSEGDKAAEQRATWLLEVSAINAALDDVFAAMNGLEGIDE